MKNYETFVSASLNPAFIETIKGEASRTITGEWLVNSKRLYKFDVFSAVAKSEKPFAPVTHTDTAKFDAAIKGEWYNAELKAVEKLISDMSNVSADEKKEATKGLTPETVKRAEDGFQAAKNRAIALRDMLKSIAKPAAMTISVIVAVIHGDKTTNCQSYIETMYKTAKTGKAKETKDAMLDFVKAWWNESDKDGILPYSCNINNGMIKDVMSAANGHHVFRDGYAQKQDAKSRQVMNECVLCIIEVLQARNETNNK